MCRDCAKAGGILGNENVYFWLHSPKRGFFILNWSTDSAMLVGLMTVIYFLGEKETVITKSYSCSRWTTFDKSTFEGLKMFHSGPFLHGNFPFLHGNKWPEMILFHLSKLNECKECDRLVSKKSLSRYPTMAT